MVLSLGRNGGCVRYASAILDEWHGPRTHNVVSSFTTEQPPRRVHQKLATYRSVPEFVLRTLFAYPWFVARVFWGLIRGRYAALYLPYSHHWETLIILLFRAFGKRVVYTVHDGIEHAGEKTTVGAILWKIGMRSATDLIFLTQHVATEVTGRLTLLGRVHVIPHGVFRLPGVVTTRHHSNRPNILFLGRISRYKGVELLCEAVRGLNREEFGRLVVAGSPSYDLAVAPFDGLTIERRWLSETDIIQHLNDAHILVLPYVEATQSGVVAHAIDACLPVVATRVGGLPEQFEDGEAVFVDPDPGSIREGLRRLCRDPELYSSIQTRLEHKRAAASWATIAEQVAAVVIHRAPADCNHV